MASSSSDNSALEKHDVFLSFRGEDTRRGFTSHLYEALDRIKIQIYIDYKLERGEEMRSRLPFWTRSVNRKLSVIIFSKNYASSRWCLDELVHILKCRASQFVILIFYDVDPSDVRKQSGSYADAFVEHEKCFEDYKLKAWREALTTTGNIFGFESDPKIISSEAELVKLVVNDVLAKLNRKSQIQSLEGLVGIEKHIQNVELLLSLDSHHVIRTVGIWGMGGIGKTTIADVVFHRLVSQFKDFCFLQNVRERSETGEGLYDLRNKLLRTLLNDKDLHVATPSMGSTIMMRLSHTNALVVLDDVSDSDQVEFLNGVDGTLFGRGSRIIVTARNKRALGVNERLWNKDMQIGLGSLKHIDLSLSEDLAELPDLSESPNLERIQLRGCSSLVQIPSTFQHHAKLTDLNLQFCYSLKNLPEMPCNLKVLQLGHTKVEEFPSSVWSLEKLQSLDTNSCKQLKILPTSTCRLNSLRSLQLDVCYSLESLPVGLPAGLVELQMHSCTSIRSLHDVLIPSELKRLILSGCKNLTSLPVELPAGLEELFLNHCENLGSLPVELPAGLRRLYLEGCKNLVFTQVVMASTKVGCTGLHVTGDCHNFDEVCTLTSLVCQTCHKINNGEVVCSGTIHIYSAYDYPGLPNSDHVLAWYFRPEYIEPKTTISSEGSEDWLEASFAFRLDLQNEDGEKYPLDVSIIKLKRCGVSLLYDQGVETCDKDTVIEVGDNAVSLNPLTERDPVS